MSKACPSCRTGDGAHASVSQPGVSPKPGDWTICFYCAAVCEFGPEPELEPRLVTAAELAAADEDVRRAVSAAVEEVAQMRTDHANGEWAL